MALSLLKTRGFQILDIGELNRVKPPTESVKDGEISGCTYESRRLLSLFLTVE
jgi:hypothetical protein